MHRTYRENSCQQWESKRAPETVGERTEKEEKLTAATRVCSGKSEGGRSGLISPANVEDVEDEFITSVASRLDSLNRDDAEDGADLQDASAWRRVVWSDGARSPMATTAFGEHGGEVGERKRGCCGGGARRGRS
jgi:hypothetical protein